MGWLELTARHAKLVERREARQSATLWRRHTAEAHAMRTRGAH